MSELHRITLNAAQLGGRPCIRGPRMRVRDVLDLLAGGAGREAILAESDRVPDPSRCPG